LAKLPDTFDPDANDYGTFGTPDPVPAGEYTAMIVDSEEKENKAGTGSYIRLVMEITEGEYKGRKLFEIMNVYHSNAMTVRIAMAEMTQLCNACGGMRPKDTVELHHIPFRVKVSQRKREDTGDMQNQIKGFSAVGATPTAPATAAGGGDKPPWKK